MMRIKRPRFLTIYFRKRELGDIHALLRGEIRITHQIEPVALTLLDRQEYVLRDSELAALSRMPADWLAVEDISPEADRPVLIELAERGVLLSDRMDADAIARREHEQALAATSWEHHAAVHHYTSRWHGHRHEQPFELAPVPIQQVSDQVPVRFDRAVTRFGPPPAAFRERDPSRPLIELPRPQPQGRLFELLRERCSTRLYERDAHLSLADLNTVLHTVWGAQGYARISRDMTVLKKTSPSAGGLHPIEVYPMVRRVRGLDPGVYHYDVAGHGLQLVRPMSEPEVADFIEHATAGQDYFATAHVVFALTARFQRTFWKYREHKKAYRAVLLDAAHLSQTLFLVAAELGLGAFITAAINEVDIEQILALDGYREGAIALCGCGVKVRQGQGMSLEATPYEPNVTQLEDREDLA